MKKIVKAVAISVGAITVACLAIVGAAVLFEFVDPYDDYAGMDDDFTDDSDEADKDEA